jgi:outer membrane protein
MKIIKYILLIPALALFQQAVAQTVDLSLSRAIEMALEKNYGINISRASEDIATINNHWGNAGRYPSIGFDASSNNSYDLADNSSTNRLYAGVGLDWVLFNGFKVRINKSILETNQDLATGRLAVVIENTIDEVILGYYAVLLEMKRLEVLKSVMDLSKDRYDYELKKKELGSSVTYNVLQAENLYLNDKASFLDQEMRVRNARRNFNFTLAEDPSQEWNFAEDFMADTTHFKLGDLHEKMLSSNQTLKNQYANLLLKQDDVKLKEAAFYPVVSTSIGMDNSFTRSKTGSADPLNFESFSPYGNLRLSYDIYQGGVRKRALKVAQINEEVSQVSIEQMEHSLTNQLYNVFDYYEVRISLLSVAEKSLAAAELNLKISEDKYKAGAINSFNYRDVQMLYLEAAQRKLQAIYNLVDSKSQITRITGGYISQYAQ